MRAHHVKKWWMSYLGDPIEVKSGVIQGGILSPLLFVLVMDFVIANKG